MSSALLIVVLVAGSASAAYGQPTRTTPLTSDTALIAHLKRTDHVFQSAFGNCQDERITRASVERRATFIYRGSCAIRPVPEHDCRFYRVEASGTIDGPEWATIRQMNLTLECSH